MEKSKKHKKKSKFKLLHQYYSYTGFYKFIGASLKKSIIPIIAVVVGIYLFNEYYQIDKALEDLTKTFSKTAMLSTFYLSETILGLLPPELFIGWAKKSPNPILNLSILALLSYAGGMTAFLLGKWTLRIKSVNQYLETKMSKHLKNTNKWGGFLIIVGAMLPLPFAMTCLAAGMIKYPFKGVALFGLFRFLRFAIYGYLIFSVVS